MAIWTYDQIVQAAQSVGFSANSAQTIAAIALAESGGNTQAISSPNTNGTRDYGLVQINSVHFGNGTSQAQALNPIAALSYALSLSSGGTNFTPWSTFNSGAYQKYSSSSSGGGGSSTATIADTSTLAGLGTFITSTGDSVLIFTIAITLVVVGLYFLAK
jgi:hypothetical protein